MGFFFIKGEYFKMLHIKLLTFCCKNCLVKLGDGLKLTYIGDSIIFLWHTLSTIVISCFLQWKYLHNEIKVAFISTQRNNDLFMMHCQCCYHGDVQWLFPSCTASICYPGDMLSLFPSCIANVAIIMSNLCSHDALWLMLLWWACVSGVLW